MWPIATKPWTLGFLLLLSFSDTGPSRSSHTHGAGVRKAAGDETGLGERFFIGRLVGYSFWVTTASAIRHRMGTDSFESASYVGVYFILSQLLLVPTIYLFTRIDWRAALEERRLRWFKAIGHHKRPPDAR